MGKRLRWHLGHVVLRHYFRGPTIRRKQPRALDVDETTVQLAHSQQDACDGINPIDLASLPASDVPHVLIPRFSRAYDSFDALAILDAPTNTVDQGDHWKGKAVDGTTNSIDLGYGHDLVTGQAVRYDPAGRFESLAAGQVATDTFSHDINGGDGRDLIFGGNGIDKILGGAGDDERFGRSGNDLLVGGLGNDRLWGGNGNDLLLSRKSPTLQLPAHGILLR